MLMALGMTRGRSSSSSARRGSTRHSGGTGCGGVRPATPRSTATGGWNSGCHRILRICNRERLFPVFTIGLVAGTTLLVLTVTTIVSFMPVRRIAKLKPTDALRGKFT